MTEKDQVVLRLKLSELNELWQDYCQSHGHLYELTCDEYMHLLASDIDSLEKTLEEKNSRIDYIKSVEEKRLLVLQELNELSPNKAIVKVADVVELARSLDDQSEAIRLEKLNLLLLDMVEKIQDQNKLNQHFLNRAILSLKDLKESFSGRKTFKTYGATGATSSNNVAP